MSLLSSLIFTEIFIYVIAWAIGGTIWGIATNAVIRNRGYSENWFWWGFFFGLIALLVAISKPENRHGYYYQNSETDSYLDKISGYSYSESSGKNSRHIQNRSAGNNEWKCWCGRINANYVGTCGCGRTMEEVRRTVKGAGIPGKWTCKCGRVNESYVGTCGCGRTMEDNK